MNGLALIRDQRRRMPRRRAAEAAPSLCAGDARAAEPALASADAKGPTPKPRLRSHAGVEGDVDVTVPDGARADGCCVGRIRDVDRISARPLPHLELAQPGQPSSSSIRRSRRRRRRCRAGDGARRRALARRRRRRSRWPARLSRHRCAASDCMEGIRAPRHTARARCRVPERDALVLDYATLHGLDHEARIRRLTAWVLAGRICAARVHRALAGRRVRTRRSARRNGKRACAHSHCLRRLMRERIGRHSFELVAIAIAAAIASHAPHLPIWLCIDRAAAARRARRDAPSRRGDSAARGSACRCAGLLLVAVVLQYGNVFGREPGSALGCGLLALKLLETEHPRDARVGHGFRGFRADERAAVRAEPLRSRSRFRWRWSLLLAALVSLQPAPGEPRHRLRAELRVGAILLACGLPLAAAGFTLIPRLATPLWGAQDRRHGGTHGP